MIGAMGVSADTAAEAFGSTRIAFARRLLSASLLFDRCDRGLIAQGDAAPGGVLDKNRSPPDILRMARRA
jgi:hypothetical protein